MHTVGLLLSVLIDPFIYSLKGNWLFLQDPAHRDSEPDLVFEDMTVMSDFELHRLCLEEQVKRNFIALNKCFFN